jgi:hypothetical protein
MLVLGAGRDAKRVAEQIAARSKQQTAASPDEATLVWNGVVAQTERSS